jgi:ABC-type nitrate/sulfonate/bicarbonate transport system substrate-binding protein
VICSNRSKRSSRSSRFGHRFKNRRRRSSLRLALNQFALSPSDVQIIQVGGSQGRLLAMKSGAIQATVLSPEETLVAQKLGYGVLFDFIDKYIP